MKKWTPRLSMLLITTVVTLAFCSKSDNNINPGSNTDPNTITIKNMAYSKPSLNVAIGTTVTWVNQDNIIHTVTAEDNSFDSGDIAPGGSFMYKFSTAGTFAYYCKYHSSITGKVMVVLLK